MKILAQRPTHVSAVATVLLITKTFIVKYNDRRIYINKFGGYSKTRYKKLFTHVESHASAVSLLESGE